MRTNNVTTIDITQAVVGSKIKFTEEKLRYTVQARGVRYLVCTKPFNARRTVLYTVVDLQERIRGTENLVFGAGAETREQCEEMIDRLEGKGCDNGSWHTEISRRNNILLNIQSIDQPKVPA